MQRAAVGIERQPWFRILNGGLYILCFLVFVLGVTGADSMATAPVSGASLVSDMMFKVVIFMMLIFASAFAFERTNTGNFLSVNFAASRLRRSTFVVVVVAFFMHPLLLSDYFLITF